MWREVVRRGGSPFAPRSPFDDVSEGEWVTTCSLGSSCTPSIPKDRLILPARFRELLTQAYVTSQMDGCLALWAPAEFQARAEEMKERAKGSAADRTMARVFFAGAQEASPDRQGRIAIPANLRQFAGLDWSGRWWSPVPGTTSRSGTPTPGSGPRARASRPCTRIPDEASPDAYRHETARAAPMRNPPTGKREDPPLRPFHSRERISALPRSGGCG